jgi:hypothetical protein
MIKKIFIVFFSLFFLVSCVPNPNNIDFSEYTEGEVMFVGFEERGVHEFEIIDVALDSTNEIYLVLGRETLKGRFISVTEEGNTRFDTEKDVTEQDWHDAYMYFEIHVYYK